MDEAALVMAARDGDQRAFADLVNAHRNQIWAVCLQICGNQHDAEDALQATLLAAWRNLDKVPRRGEILHLDAPDRSQQCARVDPQA